MDSCKLTGRNRGQASIEYLIMIGFVIFLIISILGISLFYSSLISDTVKTNHIRNFANKIISSSERVFYAGEPSLTTIIAYLPAGVEGLGIGGKEILLNFSTSTGITRISFSSNVPLSGMITKSEGVKRIKIEATSTNVVISEDSSLFSPPPSPSPSP